VQSRAVLQVRSSNIGYNAASCDGSMRRVQNRYSGGRISARLHSCASPLSVFALDSDEQLAAEVMSAECCGSLACYLAKWASACHSGEESG
jgi:hypothetical protein